MTTTQAAALRVKWSQRTSHEDCKHITLELESDEAGNLADNYNCISCGQIVALKRN